MKHPVLSALALLPFLASPSHAEPFQIHPIEPSRAEVESRRSLEMLRPLQVAGPEFVIGVGFQSAGDLIVKTLIDGLPAKEAGFQVGDQILAVNKIKVSDQKALRGIINAAGDQELKIAVLRDEKKVNLSLTPKQVKKGQNTVQQFKGPGMPFIEQVPSSSDRLLSEILGELKKLNSRGLPQPPVLRQAIQTTRPAPVPATRSNGRRVVLPSSEIPSDSEANPAEGTPTERVPGSR